MKLERLAEIAAQSGIGIRGTPTCSSRVSCEAAELSRLLHDCSSSTDSPLRRMAQALLETVTEPEVKTAIPSQYVPTWNYRRPPTDPFSEVSGGEFYEVRVFADFSKEIPAQEIETGWESFGAPDEAISAESSHVKRLDSENFFLLVTVHGTTYPDNSPVPDNGIIWDSRYNNWR